MFSVKLRQSVVRLQHEFDKYKKESKRKADENERNIQELTMQLRMNKRAIADLFSENKKMSSENASLKARLNKLKSTHQLTHLNSEVISKKLNAEEAEEYKQRVKKIYNAAPHLQNTEMQDYHKNLDIRF